MSSLVTLVSPSGLLDIALKSAALMLLAVVAAVLLGRASAAWRHLIWCLSVASLLLLPVLSLALPGWRVAWLPLWIAEPTQLAATGQTTLALAGHTEPLIAEPTTTITLPPSDAAEAVARTTSPEPVIEATSPKRGSLPWLAITWSAGGLLSLVPLAVGLWQLGALHRRSRVIDDQRWLTLLDELRRRLMVGRNVQLRQSEAALVPLTWGALRPVLLVPAEASAWPDERRRLVLLHELAHVRRWDWLTQLVAHVACAMYWFNPLVWLAARQMRNERERACDDLVLASGAKASDYAQELLSLAALSDSRLSTLVAVPMARRGALEDRLCGILDKRRSRVALTTSAVCLGAALAAAAIAPLAMLRAAPPQPPQLVAEAPKADPPPADTPVADKPAQRDPTPEEIEARTTGIRISVLNAKGDRGIPEFRVVAGVNSGGVASEFEKRTGQTVINWQPHTCRMGKEGDYVWPLAKAYPEMALRVEADGYQPQVITGVRKDKGVQHIVFQLAADKGVAGRVLTTDSKPAAGATVALALPHQEIVWEEGKLRGADMPLPEKPGDLWQRPRFIKTDAEGRFRLPTEFEPAAVLVIHESGVMEMSYDAWQKSSEVTLQRWGSIEGQILWQDKPGADEEVSLTVHRDEYGYPGMIASYAKTRTGKDGKFAFDRVLPGLVQISRPIKPSVPNNMGITAFVLNGMFQHIKVVPGDAAPVLLGGQGRKVTGKFVGLDSWEGTTYHFHPEAPHIGFGGDDASWKAFNELKASPLGPLFFRDKQPINKDGTFTIEKMLPGSYQFFLSAPNFPGYAASAKVQVDPEVPGKKPAALELKGIATVKKPIKAAQTPGDKAVEKAAEKPAEKPAAKTVSVHGKVVDDPGLDQPIAHAKLDGIAVDDAGDGGGLAGPVLPMQGREWREDQGEEQGGANGLHGGKRRLDSPAGTRGDLTEPFRICSHFEPGDQKRLNRLDSLVIREIPGEVFGNRSNRQGPPSHYIAETGEAQAINPVATGRRGNVQEGFRTPFEVGSLAGLSDAKLLDRVSMAGSATAEVAFAALVERHGPMVLRVCRKALGDPHDAHDAFQSTFLVLARKAEAIRDRRSVASFLHGVALRVAASSRAAEARRRRHERRKAEGSPSTVTLEEPSEIGAILHHEVGRLPGRYRDVVVLCYLEGRTYEEAAGHLQLPVGTVKSRLSWARQRLRDRLTKRGLAPAAGAVATILAAEAAHATMLLPATWVDATAESALKFAAAGTGTVSGPAAALAHGMIYAMMMNKIKLAAVATLGLLVTGAALMGQEPGPARSADSDLSLTRKTSIGRLQEPGPARSADSDRLRSVESKLERLISVLERQAERQAPRVTAPRVVNHNPVEERLVRLEMRMDQLERHISGRGEFHGIPADPAAPSALPAPAADATTPVGSGAPRLPDQKQP